MQTINPETNKPFRPSARAIVITNENKILLIKRTKKGIPPYFVTPGGGLEKNEDSITALKRELLEETGSEIKNIRFLFHLDDWDMSNSVDFYICTETNRTTPTGNEWTRSNDENKYELYEATFEELSSLNLKPKIAFNALIQALTKELSK